MLTVDVLETAAVCTLITKGFSPSFLWALRMLPWDYGTQILMEYSRERPVTQGTHPVVFEVIVLVWFPLEVIVSVVVRHLSFSDFSL